MGFVTYMIGALVVVLLSVANGDPLVPALLIFGDSVVDVGNNNNMLTLIKANFPPYGRDFVSHRPTGRFSNGKLATDFTAEYLGFSSYPPAYLSEGARRGNNILNGVNFASAASGYYESTARLYRALTLRQQLAYYTEWQGRVVDLVGRAKADDIFSGAIHLISAGTSDFIQNYYINPILNTLFSTDRFSNSLIESYSNFIQNLYNLGARRIGVTSLPPTGCLPAAITLFGFGRNECVARLNRDAVAFNGFFESRKACCGTGVLETSFLCNVRSVGTCSNATEYVFWDGFHPTQAANEKLAQSLLEQGFDLIG
ncbi:GDSL esterase/lipase At5g03810-like isoform X2 [Primulina huaijiensis]|uniref:GDSL esterase/lipase At5g03810-like isoform X2 n=1 Tax=Primulina huaijiensis TaxID=1492673 RepID=UPI003CC6F489